MKVGVIGAGRVGGTLGEAFAKAGHEVRYGLREPSKSANAVTIREAVQWADVVVLAVPFGAAQSAVEAGGDFAGKPLLDATNPIGPDLSLLHGHDDSGAERVAAWASNANVVKIFNTTGYENMANPAYPEGAAMMPYCGDDESACEIAKTLAADIGFDPIFIGPLTKARILEPMALVWITLAMQQDEGRAFAFLIGRRAASDLTRSST